MKKIDISEKKVARILLWFFVLLDIGIPAALSGLFLYIAIKDGLIQ